MNNRISDHARHFLQNFRGETQGHLIQFCEEVWRLESDVCIFMARKAAALMDCLRELHLADVRGVAVNDRILDTDIGWLHGKRVTLVDDCVFSGTTLYRARRAILAAGGASCDVLALAVNKDAIRQDLLPGGSEQADLSFRTPLFALTDSQCVQQCYEIVRAIAAHPMPYDVDFPHTLTAKLDANALSQLLLLPGWQSFDVSSQYQCGRGVRSFSIIPDQGMLDRFMKITGHARTSIQTAKIRVYARDMGTAWSVRIVPICVLACLSEETISSQVSAWLETHAISPETVGLPTASAMYRILTYAISVAFYRYFIDSSSSVDVSMPLGMREDLLDMSFYPGFSNRIGPALSDTTQLALPPTIAEPVAPFPEKYDFTPVISDDPISIATAIREPFTWLYRRREVGARAIIKERGLSAIDSAEYASLSRLLYGFSPASLLSRVTSSDYNTGCLLSLLIDKYVDMGIAVPTNVSSQGAVYRAFRHGEDAVFGEAQERLTVLALVAFLEVLGRDGVWGLELQKFIVLFVQIALRNSMLDRVDTSESVNVGCRVVSVKGHLHGPVPLSKTLDPSGDLGPPFIEGFGTHLVWLVDSWVARGILSENRTDKGRYYSIANVPDMSIGERAEAASRMIGRSIAYGMLLPEHLRPLDHNQDLVMLSTCAEPDHQARALSAELRILHERWPIVLEQVRRLAQQKHFDIAHRDLRSSSELFTAVNSGAMKYRWYQDRVFKARIQEVASGLTVEKRFDAADSWRQMWPEALVRDKSNTPDDLQENIDASGGWLVASVLCILLIDYWLLKRAAEERQCETMEVDKLVGDIEVWCGYVCKYTSKAHHDPARHLATEVKSNCKSASRDIVAKWSQASAALLDKLSREVAVGLTENTILILSIFAKASQPVRSYPYALFVDVSGAGEDSVIVARRAVEEAATPLATPYFLLPAHHNPWRRGVWLLLTGNRGSDRLCRVARRVGEALTAQGHAFRMVMIGQLSWVNSVRCKPGSPAFAYGTFFRRIVEMKEQLLPAAYESWLTVASPAMNDGESEKDKFARLSRWRSSSSRIIASGGGELTEESYEMAEFRVPTATRRGNEFANTDIGILTVLPTEAAALRGVFKFGQKDIKGPETDRYFDLGNLQVGDRHLKVVHCQMREAGSGAALAAFVDLIREANPRLVCISGIAGAITPHLSLGDVVIANKIIYYDRRKIVDEGVDREACIHKATTPVVDIFNAYFRENKKGFERRTVDKKPHDFKAVLAPLGCGEAVIAKRDSDVKKWLLATDRKTVAVEMESASVAHGFWEMGQSRTQKLLGILVVRGISDGADKTKGDDYQYDAAANAAFLLRRLLRYYRPHTGMEATE